MWSPILQLLSIEMPYRYVYRYSRPPYSLLFFVPLVLHASFWLVTNPPEFFLFINKITK